MPGAAGLLEGMRAVRHLGTEEILRRERRLTVETIRRLDEMRNITVFSGVPQSGVVSFVPVGQDPVLFGEALCSRWNLALRCGLHCAPLAHKTAGTLPEGTIRVSFGPMNCMDDVDALTESIAVQQAVLPTAGDG